MNYIIYDLEFNQKHLDSTESESSNTLNLPFEIIQIGALKLNENFQTVSKFNALIKPNVYPNIHPYVENLTKITNDKVNSCKGFVPVCEDFLKFIDKDEAILCVWGTADIKELLRNINFYNLSTSSIPKLCIDIQKYASKYFNTPNKSRIGLKTAADLLSIQDNGEFHDALNDAYYTAEVFKHIYDDTIKPSIYEPNFTKRVTQPKEKIDTAALIHQFEKMYNREMSKEEKSMIKLAYAMGRTGQFVINVDKQPES